MSDARSASRPSQHPYLPRRGFETAPGVRSLGPSLALCHQIGALSRTAAFQMKLAGELRVLTAAARQALAMPTANPQACEDPAAFLKRVDGIVAGRTARTTLTADTGAS